MEPSFLEHQMALHQLLLRFWVTDHEDCPFREESLEKVTVVTSKRHSRASGNSVNLEYLKNLRFPSHHARPAREAARHAFCNRIGRFKFLKWHQLEWQIAATRVLIDFKSSEVGTLRTVGPQSSSVQPTIAFSESISNVNISFCT